jgi:DNA primase catalytic core
MARIPEDQVERIKREVSLEGLVSGKGIVLSRKGRDLVGLCPFHEEDTPSLIVSQDKNLFHCMGCGAAGSVIDWVMRMEGISFRHAVELLLKDALPLVAKTSAAESAARNDVRPLKRGTIPKLEGPFESEAEDHELADQVIDFYHQKLREHPDALAYLKKRGIDDPALIDHFKLGFADRTLGYRLPYRNRQTGVELRGRLQRLGFIRDSGHEHFTGSIVIPILDADHVVQCYGRKINDNLRKGTAYHLYLPGEHKAVWNFEALQSEEIILCESLIDALTFWTNGFRNVTTSYGIRGFLKDIHLAAFRKHGTKRILIAYDRDEPGDKAAADLAELLQAEGIETARILFPKGMDANAYACTMKPAAKALELLVRSCSAGTVGGSGAAGPDLSGFVVGGEDTVREESVAVPGPAAATAKTATPTKQTEVPQLSPRTTNHELRTNPPDPAPTLNQPPSIAAKGKQHGEATHIPQMISDSAQTNSPKPPSSAVHKVHTVHKVHPVHPTHEPTPIPSPLAAHPNATVTEPPTEQTEALGSLPRTSHPAPRTNSDPMQRFDVDAEIRDGEIFIQQEDRHYRVRNLDRNLSPGQLKINLLVVRGQDFHMDTLDLCQDRQRLMFVKRAAVQLECGEQALFKDLGRLLFKLEDLQTETIRTALEPKDRPVEIGEQAREEALALLRDPELTARIRADFTHCGLVGEETNTLLAYLAATSRKLPEPLPLAVIIQSSSAAGKTTLMDAVLAMMPPEEVARFSAMTGQSLFYMGRTSLRHKILAIVEEEGAERAAYALKVFQSDGRLTMASTGKDPKSGDMQTREYSVEGPVMILMTTTAVDIDEEFQNRCLMLSVDESRQQTRAIQHVQRQGMTLEGLKRRKSSNHVLERHRNAQRLLRPLYVVNPYARELTFLDERTRMRRDHMKYLTLIASVTLLHQYQRPVKTVKTEQGELEYIETTIQDMEIANTLAHQALGRSLDELLPQTRKLLNLIFEMVTKACETRGIDRADARFTRRDVRAFTHWGNSQIAIHMDRLVAYEYLIPHGGRRGQCFVYECRYDGQGQDGGPFAMGLIDTASLTSGVNGHASFRGQTPTFRTGTRAFPDAFRDHSGANPGVPSHATT